MKKLNFSRMSFLSLLAAGVLVTSCSTDDKYDLNELDLTIGVGTGEGLSLPTSSTTEIKVADILELEDGDCVSEDPITHDYLFHQESNDIAATYVKVDKITINVPDGKDLGFSVDIPNFNVPYLSPKAGVRKALPFGHIDPITLEANKDLQMFTATKDLPNDVYTLDEVKIESNKVKLTINFGQLSGLLNKIDDVVFYLPDFMEISKVVIGSEDKTNSLTKGSNGYQLLTLKNVPAADMNMELTIDGIEFDKANATSKNLWIEDGKIQLKGDVKMSVTTKIDFDEVMDVNKIQKLINLRGQSVRINSSLVLKNFIIKEARGQFDPIINMENLGSTTINNVPSFLNEEGTCVDLYNPQIYVKLENNLPVPGTINGKIYAYDKNHDPLPGTPVEVKGIKISPENNSPVICICRDSEAPRTAACDQVVPVQTLSSLVRTIPKTIEFKEVEAVADANYVATLELGKDYEIKPSYWVDAPIAFAEDANLIYTEDFDGLADDLEDIELTPNSFVSVSATVLNKIPAYLSVEVEPVDKNKRPIPASELKVDVNCKVKASNGTNVEASALDVKITQVANNALKKLDGFNLKIHLKAKEGNDKITGVVLNGEKHTVKIEDMRVKFSGTAIYDAN